MKTLRCLPPIVFSFLALSVQAEPKQDCSNVLESLGYNLDAYTSKKAGWVSKEKHIFNGTLICYIGSDKKIHSIEDNGFVIVKDGFFGQKALAKRDELNAERKRKIKKSKRDMEAEFEESKRKINEAFDAKIQKLKQDSEPGSSTTEPVVLEPADQREQMAVDSQREVGQKPTSQPELEPTTVVVADEEAQRPPVAQALTPLACKEHPNFPLSYDAPVQIRRIVKDTVEKMGMKVGPLDALPANKKRAWYFSSSGPTALSVLSRGEDWAWFTHGDTVKFRKRDDIKGLVIYEVLDIKPRLNEGKLVLNLETDLPDEAEVTVEIYRSYEAKGQDRRSETYSHQYFRECGTIARWKAKETIPIDEAAWRQALKAHQDKMGRLGKDMAFEIVAINDHITVSASGGISTASGSSLQRLKDEERVLKRREALAGQSLHVSWDALEVGRAYRFLKIGIPLMPQRGVDGKLMGTMLRLTDKAIVVVQAVENSVPNSLWYLVSVDGRRGWVNGDALLGSGAVGIPSRGEQDPKQLRYRQEIAQHVLKPCLSRAYEKAVRSSAVRKSNSMKSEMIRAMIDASHDMLAEFIKEATDLGLGLLPLTDRMEFYRKSRDYCIAGT